MKSPALRHFVSNEFFVLACVLVVTIVISAVVTGGKTISADNARLIMFQTAANGVGAIGQTLVIVGGGIDLAAGGIGQFASLTGAAMWTTTPLEYNFAKLLVRPFPPAVVPLMMILTGAGWGSISGLSVSRLRIPPLIVTLSMWKIVGGLAFLIGAGRTVYAFPESVAFLGQGTVLGIPVAGIVFIVISILAYLAMTRTILGRSVVAVGGNPISAWLSGINVSNTRFLTYAISGALTGLSASMYTSRIMSASTQSMLGFELQTVAASVIGGVSLAGGIGNIIGVVLGSVIMGVISNTLSVVGAAPTTQGVVTGLVIFLAVGVDSLRRRKSALV